MRNLLTILFSPKEALALTAADTGVLETGTAVYGNEQANVSLGFYLGNNVIVPLFGLLGVVFLVLMIYSGLIWMTSSGNTENIGKAKRTMVHAVIGLFILVLSYAITRLVFQAVLGDL